MLLEVADQEQALRVARLAQKLDIFDGIEIWRDEPTASADQSANEDGIPFQGQGNARSVICWRGVGGLWLGKTSTLHAPETSQQTSPGDLSPSFSWDPTIIKKKPLLTHEMRVLMGLHDKYRSLKRESGTQLPPTQRNSQDKT